MLSPAVAAAAVPVCSAHAHLLAAPSHLSHAMMSIYDEDAATGCSRILRLPPRDRLRIRRAALLLGDDGAPSAVDILAIYIVQQPCGMQLLRTHE